MIRVKFANTNSKSTETHLRCQIEIKPGEDHCGRAAERMRIATIANKNRFRCPRWYTPQRFQSHAKIRERSISSRSLGKTTIPQRLRNASYMYSYMPLKKTATALKIFMRVSRKNTWVGGNFGLMNKKLPKHQKPTTGHRFDYCFQRFRKGFAIGWFARPWCWFTWLWC